MHTLKPQPFLRWAGSKKQVIGKLVPYWSPTFKRYIEPFLGSATFFFSVCPPKAMLSDLNPELMDLFISIRKSAPAVHHALLSLPRGKVSYYKLRSVDPKTLPAIQRAARFIFLNRFCFNGLFRTNNAGQFNVPFSPSGTGDLPTLEELEAASSALRVANLLTGDFEAILKDVRQGDFVYLDPPYAVRDRRIFREYLPGSFCGADLKRLSKTLELIDRRGAAFVMSYALSAEALQLFRGWHMRRITVQRNISGFAKHRRRATEVIISNLDFSKGSCNRSQ